MTTAITTAEAQVSPMFMMPPTPRFFGDDAPLLPGIGEQDKHRDVYVVANEQNSLSADGFSDISPCSRTPHQANEASVPQSLGVWTPRQFSRAKPQLFELTFQEMSFDLNDNNLRVD